MKKAIAVETTDNIKTGPMSTTYASRSSCPSSCPMKKGGACYGESGPCRFVWQRLGNGGTPEQIALEEASQIDRLTGMTDLRIHTVGDCRTEKAARILAGAAKRYLKRGRPGVKAFTFTHAQNIPYRAWFPIEIIASCETTSQVKKMQAKGYPTAIVVENFAKEGVYVKDGVCILPCRHQVGKAHSCLQCRLCLNASALKKQGITIGFKIHGSTVKAAAVLRKLEAQKA